jgi:hypothetical protein
MADKKLGQLEQYDQSELIRFLDFCNERQYHYHIMVAEHRHYERQAREKTIRLLMAGIGGLVIVAFVYTGITKDSRFPKELLWTVTTITAVGRIKALKGHQEKGKNKSETVV